MLVLARHPGEAIRIASEIRVIVNSAERNRVLVGVEAPIHIAVDREEIYLRKQQARFPGRVVPSEADQRPAVEGLPPIGILGRLAQRFRARAGSYFADARRRPLQHAAVIRLTAMAEWAASEIEALERAFSTRNARKE